MIHLIPMRAFVAALLFAHSLPARASDEAFRQLALEVQASERLIAAAVATGDLAELDRQMTKPLDISDKMLRLPERRQFISCITASNALSAIARTMPKTGEAAAHLEFRDRLVRFTVDMDVCEERLGLDPPPSPNLGRAPR